MFKVITISRQFGSGGRTVGKEVAARLNIPCYDKEILEKVAANSGFCEEYIANSGEYAEHRTWLGRAFGTPTRFDGMTNQDRIWIEQRKIILELAQSPFVIVGRC